MRAVVAAVAVALAVLACSDGEDEPAGPDPPADVVPGAPADYRRITVVAGERSVEVPPAQWEDLVPLLTAREFRPGGRLAEFGLDRPVAHLRFERVDRSEPIAFSVGDENFDGTAYYVFVEGDALVRTVLDDQLDPVLALVGHAP